MSKSRHDVLFYDQDRARIRSSIESLKEICSPRAVSTLEELHDELVNVRPDVFLYVDSYESTEFLQQLRDELDNASLDFLPMVLIVNLSRQEEVIKYFPSSRLSVQNAIGTSDDAAKKLEALLYEIDRLPQVLIVGDQLDEVNALVNFLEDGCAPVSATPEDAADIMLEGYAPDVMFLDASRRKNLDICDELRQIPNCAKLPIVILSENSDKSFVVACMQKKAAGYLIKPFLPEAFREKLRDVMEAQLRADMKTILVIDDDVMMLKTLQSLLKDDYKIVALTSGDEAMRYCAKFIPDMVLLDYELPGQSGISVLKQMRMDARFNMCPIVMLTGNNERNTVMESIRAGAQGYLVKPVAPMTLRLRIRQYLGGV